MMVRSKYMYEKYEIRLARPLVEGTNELSITNDSVKNTGLSILQKKQMKENDMLRSTWIELCLSVFFLECKMKLTLRITDFLLVLLNLNITDIKLKMSVFFPESICILTVRRFLNVKG